MAGIGEWFFKNIHDNPQDWWYGLLSGEAPAVPTAALRRVYRLIPSTRRCKFCNAPFDGPAGRFMRITNQVPARLSPHICQLCEDIASSQIGGAEIESSLVFADVRGSTTAAEKMSPTDFSRIISRFFGLSSKALLREGAWIDKLVGDQAGGIFLPGFTGGNHAAAAIRAAQDIRRAADEEQMPLGIGIGIHTDVAFVGAVGDGQGATDITVLGDAANTTARLASSAAAGEILVSAQTCRSSGMSMDADCEVRTLALKGKEEPVSVYVLKE
jgi:adenylate cyclase